MAKVLVTLCIINIFVSPSSNALQNIHNVMKINILILFLSCYMFELIGQENILPHFPTKAEEKAMEEYLEQKITSSSRSVPLPPPGPVRTMAEWEPIQALVITWAGQSTILKEIVRHAVKECKVFIITTNSTNVTSSLTSAGISLDSVQFIDTPFNSIWVQDYGPWTVYKNDVDSLYLIDWIYNRPRPQDDASPGAIAGHLDIPIYEAIIDPDDWVHTGGNHLQDGLGTAFSSRLVLNENEDKTEDEIDSIAYKFLGVSQYIKFPTLPYDGIHHLDMHMRVIDEETIIVGEYPPGIADGPQINSNMQYLMNEFNTSFGNKYRIIRIPMPPDASDSYPDEGGDYRTYTNSIFINKTILVPTYEEKYDTTALRIYRENLPGYNVIGINCNSIISSLGALHCITRPVGANEPLLIAHPRLHDTDDADNEYPVTAIIKHINGIAEANLNYRIAGDSIYTIVPMIFSDTLQNLWTANIPSHSGGTEIQYYIHARSYNGKEQVRPIVAPEGYFKFRIYGEPANQPPVVNVKSPLDGSVFNIHDESIDIEVEADDLDGEIVNLVIFINGDSITTINSLPYVYRWTFPSDGQFEITIEATDDKGALTVSQPVQVSIEYPTGIDPDNHEFILIFPNPVENILWTRSELGDSGDISITNLFGQSLSLHCIYDGALTGHDFSDLSAGIYFVSGRLNGTRISKRVIKL